jgi:hypothetical protein
LEEIVSGNTTLGKKGKQDNLSMVETTPTTPATATQKKNWDLNSLLEKVLELQELLVASQESNLLLSAQTRELERVARDTDDLKSELTTQNLMLADKSRENKWLHQELTRVTTLLDTKLHENERLLATVTDTQHQLRTRESERDALAVKVNEYEMMKRRQAQLLADEEAAATANNQGFFKRFKK